MEDYEKKYQDALERMKSWARGEHPECFTEARKAAEFIFPELAESEDERIRKEIIYYLRKREIIEFPTESREKADWISWLEKQGKPQDKGEISDGYHTFNELYYYRMLYNAAFFNMLPKGWVHKSKKHHDGEECFGGGRFIVMANLPTGQISNHYELKDWDLFQIPEKEVADKWDGHTPQEVADRLYKYLLEKQGDQKPAWSEEDEDALDIAIRIIQNGGDDCAGILDSDKALKWLKSLKGIVQPKPKQGEQKPEPKFKVGDWVKHNETKEAFFIKGMRKEYCMEDIAGLTENNPTKIVDELSTIWTIQDAKDGDVLSVTMDPEGTWIGIFKEHNGGTFSSHCFVNCDGIFKIGVSGHGNVNAIHPATKEQRDQLFSKMKGAGYEWDFVKKQLKKIEQ